MDEVYKKCIILTIVSFVGSLIMICPAWDVIPFFIVWGSVLAIYMLLVYKFGGFSRMDNDDYRLMYCAMLNALGINFGGYFVIILLLKFYLGLPIPIAGKF